MPRASLLCKSLVGVSWWVAPADGFVAPRSKLHGGAELTPLAEVIHSAAGRNIGTGLHARGGDDEPDAASTKVLQASDIPAAMSPVPLVILASIVAVNGFVSTSTQNQKARTYRDPKGAVHALRVHASKTRWSLLGKAMYGDAERQRNASKADGAIFKAMRTQWSNKRVDAAKVGSALAVTGGMLAMGVTGHWEPIRQTIMQDIKAQGGGIFAELEVGKVYESRDEKGNWWQCKVDGANGDGSYKCSMITKGVVFEDPCWPVVWPANCRYVTQRSLVTEDHMEAVAVKA